MSRGKTHLRFNLLVGSIITGLLFGLGLKWIIVVSFVAGYLFSTLIFSPDSDLNLSKKASWLRPILYPYSLLFKHRGLSHNIFLGTLTRLVYGLVVVFVFYLVLYKMGYLEQTPVSGWHHFIGFLRGYNYGDPIYQGVTWIFIGMVMADWGHIFLDTLSSFWRKTLKFLHLRR